MDRDNCCSPGVAVLSFLTGAVLGAGLALLYAPKTGRETREMLGEYGTDIKGKASGLRTDVKGKAETLIERGSEMINRGKNMVGRGSDMLSHGKEYIDEKRQTLASAIEAGKEAMKQEKENLSSSLSGEDE